jgi:hypothetical protein
MIREIADLSIEIREIISEVEQLCEMGAIDSCTVFVIKAAQAQLLQDKNRLNAGKAKMTKCVVMLRNAKEKSEKRVQESIEIQKREIATHKK